jgi:hypothetical protein
MLRNLVLFQALYSSENFNLSFHKGIYGKQLATLKGKEKPLQLIFLLHLIVAHFL